MPKRKKIVVAFMLLLFVISFSAAGIYARSDESKAIAKHLKTKYKAKKVKIPFMWLARFAVRVVRPAGVKSFSVTLYEDLQFSKETLDMEMQKAMRNALSEEWIPIFRIRSREGQQAYMYMRESGQNVRLMLVTIENDQAALIQAKINPEKLAEFINDPKIFGISLDSNNSTDENSKVLQKQQEETIKPTPDN